MAIERLIIIGSGAAGLTAAIYAARAGLDPLVVTGPQQGGLLTQTGEVENFPGFPESVNGYELMDRMRKQAERFVARFVTGTVRELDLNPGGIKKVTLSDESVLETRALIIATGSSPRWLGLPSEQAYIGRGVSACATCDGAFYRGRIVAVIGGGDTAMEEALALTRFAREVHIIHRRDSFRATRIMVERVQANEKIVFHWNQEVAEMLGDERGLTGLKLRNTLSGAESELACDGCFVALGHVPGTDLVKGKLDLDPQGCIRLLCLSAETSVPGVFAAGDCADSVYRQAVMAAGMGCRAAIDAAHWLENEGL